MAYDDSDHADEFLDAGKQTGAANATINKFIRYRATRLKRVVANIMTAGTASTAAWTILNGTTSVGSLAIGTNTAGVTVDSGAINALVPAGSFIEIKGNADGATAVASVQINLQMAD